MHMKKTSIALMIFCLTSGVALAQQQGVQRSQTVVETQDPTAQLEKRIMEMTSMMKASGFEAQQIEAYQELAKKNFSQMLETERNEKLKQSEKDATIKKIISSEEAELKKILGKENFEKYLELQKTLGEN